MSITQQYGNSLMSPYGQQDYSNFFGSRGMAGNYNTMPVQGMGNNLIWVQGIEGAKAFMLQPNAKVIMLDSEIENRAYIKIADELGATKLRKFELTEIQEELQTAEKYQLNKLSIDYDMNVIIEEQKSLHKKYKEMCKEV